MPGSNLTRWSVATLVFFGIALINLRYGRGVALTILLALLLLVYFFGGSGRGYGASSGGDPDRNDTGSSESPGDDPA